MAISDEVTDFYKNYCVCHYCDHEVVFDTEFGKYGICALPMCKFEPKKKEGAD